MAVGRVANVKTARAFRSDNEQQCKTLKGYSIAINTRTFRRSLRMSSCSADIQALVCLFPCNIASLPCKVPTIASFFFENISDKRGRRTVHASIEVSSARSRSKLVAKAHLPVICYLLAWRVMPSNAK